MVPGCTWLWFLAAASAPQGSAAQAKAGLAAAARRTFADMRAAGLQLTLRPYNLLIIAHARAGQPEAAEALVRRDMAADGIAPDVVTW